MDKVGTHILKKFYSSCSIIFYSKKLSGIDTDSNVVMARGREGGGWIEVGTGVKMGASLIVSTIKVKI